METCNVGMLDRLALGVGGSGRTAGVGSTGSGARPTLNLISPASQLCDLQLLLNRSESQVSKLQNGEDLANAWDVECSREKDGRLQPGCPV